MIIMYTVVIVIPDWSNLILKRAKETHLKNCHEEKNFHEESFLNIKEMKEKYYSTKPT